MRQKPSKPVFDSTPKQTPQRLKHPAVKKLIHSNYQRFMFGFGQFELSNEKKYDIRIAAIWLYENMPTKSVGLNFYDADIMDPDGSWKDRGPKLQKYIEEQENMKLGEPIVKITLINPYLEDGQHWKINDAQGNSLELITYNNETCATLDGKPFTKEQLQILNGIEASFPPEVGLCLSIPKFTPSIDYDALDKMRKRKKKIQKKQKPKIKPPVKPVRPSTPPEMPAINQVPQLRQAQYEGAIDPENRTEINNFTQQVLAARNQHWTEQSPSSAILMQESIDAFDRQLKRFSGLVDSGHLNQMRSWVVQWNQEVGEWMNAE